MNPKTQEYFEAAQAEINQERENLKKNLPPEEKIKHEAVEKAVEILDKADVDFFLYPLLYNPTAKKEIVWQWNSLTKSNKFDKTGKLTAQAMEKANILCPGILFVKFYDAVNYHLGQKVSPEDRLAFFIDYCIESLKQYNNYLLEK